MGTQPQKQKAMMMSLPIFMTFKVAFCWHFKPLHALGQSVILRYRNFQLSLRTGDSQFLTQSFEPPNSFSVLLTK